MNFKNDKKEDDLLGVSRKRLFGEGAFDAALKHLETAGQEAMKKDPEEIPADLHKPDDTICEEEVAIDLSSQSVDQGAEENLSLSMSDRLIASLEEQVIFLRQQMAVKDAQLGAKDELIRNFQVLIKQDQDTILMLENKLSENRAPQAAVDSVEETSKTVDENPPKSEEVRYNELRTKTDGSKSDVVLKAKGPSSAKPAPVAKAKRSFLAGLFRK